MSIINLKSIYAVKNTKTHTMKFSNFVDYAGYKALTASFEVTVVEDKAAPVLVSAVAKNINTIEVTFNESLSAQGSFWVNGASVTATVVANSNNTKYNLTGFTLDLSAIVQVKVEYQNQKDVVGNTVSTKATYMFSIADDTALPTATLVVGTGNKITITFSKPMLTTVGNIQVLDKDKVAFGPLLNVSALTFKAGSNNTVLELTGTQVGLNSVNAGTYFVRIKDMKDATVRANLLPEQVVEISALDSKAPTVTSSYTVKAGTLTGDNLGKDDTITFYFSEAMDEATVKNLSNFVLNGGTAFSAMSGVSFKSIATDGKSATFTYPDARLLVAQTFTVYSLKDLAGNMSVTNTAVAKNTVTLDIPVTATLKATDKVEIVFSTPIASIDPSFLTVNKGADAYAVPVSATVGGTGALAGRVVTFTLNKAMDTFTTGYTVVQNNVTLATDVYGQSLASAATFAITGVNFVDAVRPTLVSVTQKTTGTPAVNVPNQFVIKMSENILFTEATLKNDLIVKYADGTPVAAGNYTLTAEGTDSILVTLVPNAKLTNGVNAITVQLFADRDLRDAATNYASTFAAQTVNVTIDAVAPTVTNMIIAPTTLTANAQHILGFSEELSTASKAAVKTIVDNAYVAGGTATVSSSWVGGNLVVTIVAGANPNDVVLSALVVPGGFTVTDTTGNVSAVFTNASFQSQP